MDNDRYEARLADAAEKVQTAQAKLDTALVQLEAAARQVLDKRAPDLLEKDECKGDVVTAAEHIEKVLQRCKGLDAQSRAIGKQARDVRKVQDKIDYAVRKLYAPLLEAADVERKRRAQKQGSLPFDQAPPPDDELHVDRPSWSMLRVWDLREGAGGAELVDAARMEALAAIYENNTFVGKMYLLVPPAELFENEIVVTINSAYADAGELVAADECVMIGDKIAQLPYLNDDVDWTGFGSTEPPAPPAVEAAPKKKRGRPRKAA